MLTAVSEEAEVGLRPKYHPARPNAPVMIVRRTCSKVSLSLEQYLLSSAGGGTYIKLRIALGTFLKDGLGVAFLGLDFRGSGS